MGLREKILQYLETHTVQDLCDRTGVGVPLIYKIIRRSHKKYNKNSIDILYNFFKLEIDDFYKKNIKRWYPKTHSLLGNYVRYRRISQGLELKELAKMMKIGERALARLEAGDSLPEFNSWTMQHLFDSLEFDDTEKEVFRGFIDHCKDIERMVKEIDIERNVKIRTLESRK